MTFSFVAVGVLILAAGVSLFLIAGFIVKSMYYVPLSRWYGWPAVILIIIGIEAYAPSTVLTGRDLPAPIPVARHLDDIPMPQRALTYAEVAESAGWFWDLGTVTQEEMKTRLRADLAVINARALAVKTPTDDIRLRLRAAVQNPLKWSISADGFQAALDGLDDLFAADTVTIAEANAYVAEALRTVAYERLDEIAAKHYAAQAAFRAAAEELEVGANGAVVQDDPALAELAQSAYNSEREWQSSVGLRSRFSSIRSTRERMPNELTPEYRFPQFPAPIPVYQHRSNFRTALFPVTQVGPEPQRDVFQTLRSWGAAFRGYQRSSALQNSEIRCGMYFVDGADGLQAEHACEVSWVLAANYDLTGRGCRLLNGQGTDFAELTMPGTHAVGGLCKESWIYPHAHVLITSDAMTVYPPRPSGISAESGRAAPLSQWSVRWGTREYVLDQPRRLELAPQIGLTNRMQLVHGVRPEIVNPRIWRDFAIDRPGRSITDAIQGEVSARHDYVPIIYDGRFAPERYAAVRHFLSMGPGRDPSDSLAEVQNEVTRQRYTLEILSAVQHNVAAAISPQYADVVNLDFCSFRTIASQSSRFKLDYDDLRDFAKAVPGPLCETYFAMQEMQRQSARRFAQGTWLSMIAD